MKKSIFKASLFGIMLLTAFGLSAQTTNFGTGSGTLGNGSTYVGVNTGGSATAATINNSFYGQDSGRSTTTGRSNSFFGNNSGLYNVTGELNCYFGVASGAKAGSSNRNSFFGSSSGVYSTNTEDNTFIGYSAGIYNVGSYNTFIGSDAGKGLSNNQSPGKLNSFLGSSSGHKNQGVANTLLGAYSGYNNITGQSNVFIGYAAGYNELGNNKLYIDNSTTPTPLIYGDFSSNKVGINTNQLPNSVGGANTSAYGLYVKGGILTEEVRVRTGWADYVFAKDYHLTPINEVETFIKENGHLPNVPSAAQVENEGIELGDIARIQQEKIEELTLYIIKLQKQLNLSLIHI